MVISGGVNIYPREIEDHLQHAPGDPRGRGRSACPIPSGARRCARSSCCATAQQLTETEVDRLLPRRALADYKRPRKVTFLAELPRNPTGKILKRELRDLREP